MHYRRFYLAIWLSVFGFLESAYAAEVCEPWAAKIESIQGVAEVIQVGKARWQRVKLHETLCAGDKLRIKSRSRVSILLYNDTSLRLDEGTVIELFEVQSEKPSFLELFKGALHYFSPRPRPFTIKAPFVNAGVEGTEFIVRVEAARGSKPEQTSIWVFEGRVLAGNKFGSISLITGEGAVAQAGKAPVRRLLVTPEDAVRWALYYPPIIDLRESSYQDTPEPQTIRDVLKLYRDNDVPAALAKLNTIPPKNRDAQFYTLRAGLLLSVGRVERSRRDIDEALRKNPKNGTALALQSIVELAQNNLQKALDLATEATRLDPDASVPLIALSYANQAKFNIEEAVENVRNAIDLTPDNALAWARLAELQLSLGYLNRALAAAKKAVELDPDLERTQTVLGFAHLTQIEVSHAKKAFDKAIRLDSAAPLPRLGLGLAKIRSGELEDGTREIEIAASLDPNNSLIRSYLGKAYFEQRHEKLAANAFAIAKRLDPNDPTPYFYDAILKQTTNRPVEALRDLQTANRLNDNRAVFRSRLLLDQDVASRGTSLARIFNNLGFERVAEVEATKSLSIDPANHSAHRFLADTYAQRSGFEIASVSELLQAQLLQPININPVQPQLSVQDLSIISRGGPARTGFNEYTPY